MTDIQRDRLSRIHDLASLTPLRASLSQIRTTNARGIEDHVAQVNERAEVIERNLETIRALVEALL